MNQQALQERNVEQVAAWMRWGLMGVAVLALAAVIAMFVGGKGEAREAEAFGVLLEAQRMEKPAMTEAETKKTDLWKVIVAWPTEKKAEYSAKLERVMKEHSGTAASAVAGLRLGRLRFESGDFAGARTVFEQVAAGAGKPEFLAYQGMALEGLANSLESEKNLTEARKAYDRALQVRDNPFKPLAYLGRARVAKAQGKKDEAKADYESVIREFPSTPYARMARVFMTTGG